jgi:predicted ArsR family transcriptional regulator
MLELVRASSTGLTTAEVAAKTGSRLSTARSDLDRLVADGLLVKARASAGVPRRPAWRYRAAAADPPPNAYRFLLAALLEDLANAGDDTHDRAAQAGRHWGRMLAAARTGERDTVVLLAVMRVLGFSPQQMDGGAEVHLLACPYLELVQRYPDAMCRVHAGVIKGVLERTGADADVVLVPFAAPQACVVRLPAEPDQT